MTGSTVNAAVKLLRRAGVLAGLLAGPFFLISIGLNTWASLGYLDQLGWSSRVVLGNRYVNRVPGPTKSDRLGQFTAHVEFRQPGRYQLRLLTRAPARRQKPLWAGSGTATSRIGPPG